ncbi:MAG: 2-oxoacid:acceptor oxidoreductase family protein [Candidatus Izemoplasmataceae bacterium]
MPKNERVVIAGFGGQGVMLMGQMLAQAATNEGLETVWIPSYGPESRGGTANCFVTISETPINAPMVSESDTLIAMNEPSLLKFETKIKKGGRLLVNASLIKDHDYRKDIEVHRIPINDLALELGNLKVANMVMLGAYLKASGLFGPEALETVFKDKFTGKKEALLDLNEKALRRGMKEIREA